MATAKAIEMKKVSVGEAKEILMSALKIHLPIFLWGQPGIGKSAIVKQICEEKKWDMEDLRLSQCNPVDLRGLPTIDREKKIAEWLIPEFFPKSGEGVLFLDEMNQAAQSVQAAAYQLVLDRRIGKHVLPDGWRVLAAGNRETDKANVVKMASPLANRLIHLNVIAEFDDWKKWAVAKKIDPRVIGFLDFKSELLATMPKDDEKAYATPRTWEMASSALSLFNDPEDARALVEGAVGLGASMEFYGWLPNFTFMPDIDAILAGKSNKIPKRADILTTMLNTMVTRLTDDNLETFLKYTMLLGGEYAVMAMKKAAEAGWEKKIDKCPSFEAWCEKYYDLISS